MNKISNNFHTHTKTSNHLSEMLLTSEKPPSSFYSRYRKGTRLNQSMQFPRQNDDLVFIQSKRRKPKQNPNARVNSLADYYKEFDTMKTSLCHIYNYYTYKDIDLKNKQEKKQIVSILKNKVNREIPDCSEKAKILTSLKQIEAGIIQKQPIRDKGDLHLEERLYRRNLNEKLNSSHRFATMELLNIVQRSRLEMKTVLQKRAIFK